MLNDDRLRQALEDEGGGPGPEEVLRNLRRRFERRWKISRIYYTCFTCLGLLSALWGAQEVYAGATLQAQFRGLVPFLFGVAILVSAQVWMSISENWLVVMQGVKELQMQAAAMEERIVAQAWRKGGPDA